MCCSLNTYRQTNIEEYMNTLETFEKLKNPASYKFEQISCYLCNEKDDEFLLVGEEDLTGKEGQFQYVVCSSCGSL